MKFNDMKYIIITLLCLIIGAIAVGFYIREENWLVGNRIVGIAVLVMAFVFMPLFIYYRYKNKKLEDFSIVPKEKNQK